MDAHFSSCCVWEGPDIIEFWIFFPIILVSVLEFQSQTHIYLCPNPLQSTGVEATVHHYGAVASAYEIAGKWQKALHLMNRVHQPNEARMVRIFGQSGCDLDGSWKKHHPFL